MNLSLIITDNNFREFKSSLNRFNMGDKEKIFGKLVNAANGVSLNDFELNGTIIPTFSGEMNGVRHYRIQIITGSRILAYVDIGIVVSNGWVFPLRVI